MANIKLKKPLLSAAILACLFGGALTTIGSITGGVNDLVNSAKSKVKLTKKEESFSDLSSLNINLAARNLVISESPDDKAHLTYYQSDGNYGADHCHVGNGRIWARSDFDACARYLRLVLGDSGVRDFRHWLTVDCAHPKSGTKAQSQ